MVSLGTVWKYQMRLVPGVGAVMILYDRYGNEIEEVVGDTADAALDKAKDIAAEAGATLEAGAAAVANATLDVVRGLGGAIIEGLDGAYDAARGKLDGKEPDVVAGLVVVTLTILTAVYLFHSAKAARDAF